MSSGDDQKFRDRALEVSLSQLAVMFAEFDGVMNSDLRFDSIKTHELRLIIAQIVATFIAETQIEPLGPELACLLEGLRSSIDSRRVLVDGERSRLERAGLVRSWR